MPSDNDGESVSSSGSGCPSPVPAAKTRHGIVAGKGILVHHNKKSANTNRVSFVTSSTSSSPSSTPPPSANKRPKRKHNQNQNQKSADNQTPYYARTGRRLTSFGIKSYLHEFYDDPEDGDLFQDDDFRYLVEPETRWHRHCCSVYAILGLIIVTMGFTVMAAGHLIPAKDPVVDRSANIEVIDRWAVAYNEHLASCRYIGSVVFAVGVVFTVIQFWISVIRGDDRAAEAAEQKLAADDRPQRRPTVTEHRQPQTVRIPITGSVENVQPDSRAINVQFVDNS